MFEGLEERVNKNGNISYWKDGEIVYKQCSKCKEIKRIEEFGNCSSNKDKHKSSCLMCNRGKQKEYYQREKDVINEKAKQYYHATIEKQRERGKRYRETHKEKEKERQRKYREEKTRIKKEAKLKKILSEGVIETKEGLELKITNKGNVSYWKDGVMIYRQCSKCKEVKEVKLFCVKNGKIESDCKECRNNYMKQRYELNKEELNRKGRERNKIYYKNNKEKVRAYSREYEKKNKDKIAERKKAHREANKELYKERQKNYNDRNKEKFKAKYEANKEKICERRKERYALNTEKERKQQKEYREKNKEHIREMNRRWSENVKKENVQKIKEILKETNPLLKELPIYGTIYKFENIKTGRVYIGQTIKPLNHRYCKGIVAGWLEERKNKQNQKFLEELKNEKDFIYEEILAVGHCKYHLDKLEVYFIDKYNSFLNGYNNTAGNYESDEGVDEFNQILNKYNLEFVDGELRRIL